MTKHYSFNEGHGRQEERTYWIENYKKFPTSNISDAMDNLGLRSGIVLGLRPLDVYQPRTAGFAKTLRQMRRKTAFDGRSLTKQASIIDSQTEYGDLLVIEATGLTDVATGGAMLATRAQMRGVMGELTNGSLRDIDEIADLKFPVYLGSTSPVKSARFMETVDTDVPVFIGALPVVHFCALHRITHFFYPHKIDALDHFSVPNVQTGDDSLCQHHSTSPSAARIASESPSVPL